MCVCAGLDRGVAGTCDEEGPPEVFEGTTGAGKAGPVVLLFVIIKSRYMQPEGIWQRPAFTDFFPFPFPSPPSIHPYNRRIRLS